MDKIPLVSICCMVYNHEPYLRDCFEGFVMQKTNFSFEILVHDDASTDKSSDIIREYTAKYTDLFKPIYQTKNQYSQGKNPNRCYLFPRVQGKYIALCEGDDYWIDSYKLQKQVDFLENNPDYGLVHANYYIVDSNNIRKNKIDRTWKSGDVFLDILTGNYHIATLSVLYRTELYSDFTEEIVEINNQRFKMGDLPLWLLFSKVSKIKYINEKMVVYRLLENSVSHSSNINDVHNFQYDLYRVRTYFADKYKIKIKTKKLKNKFFKAMIKEAYFKQDKKYAIIYYRKLLQCSYFNIFDLKILSFFLASQSVFFRKFISIIYEKL